MEIIKHNSHDEWLKTRSLGVGGSDIAAICGFSKYRTAVDVWLEKTGQKEQQPMNDAMHFGTLLEDIVAKEFQARTSMKVQKFNATLKDDFRIANIDRAIVNPYYSKIVRFKDDHLTTDCILECKTASTYSAWRWGKSQLDDILNGGIKDEASIPQEYLCQIQWYMGICKVSSCYVAVLIGGQDFRVYHIYFDKNVFEFLQQKAAIFWQHVIDKTEPEPVSAKEVEQLYETDNGNSVEADNATAAAFGDLITMRAQEKALKAQIEERVEQIKVFLGENTTMNIGGNKAVTWKTQTSKRLDSKLLKQDYPDIVKNYQKETTTRVFRISE